MLIRPRVAAIGVAVLAAGCGTTVSESQLAATGTQPPSDNGLSAPGAGVGAPAAGGGAALGPATGTSDAGGSVGTTTGSGSGAAPGTVAPSGGPTTVTQGSDGKTVVMSPGVTATTISVGLIWAKNQDSVNQAAGASGISIGDPKADAEAIIDDINKHGGIAGRRIKPVFQPVDSTSAQTTDAQLAAACDHFKNDERVFAVVGAGTASYRACLAQAGIVQIDQDLPGIGDAEFAKYPALVELGYPKLSRMAKATLGSLPAQSYFTPWNTTAGAPAAAGRAKLGILTLDDPGYDAVVNNILIPGLKRLGYNPGDDVARIKVPANSAGISNQAAANSSAELKFASDGVTHVVVFEANGGNSLLFMNQAESQHYRPRYGVNSGSGLQTLIDAGDIPRAQAVGATGFGWIPAYDLPSDMNPDDGKYSNAERQHCVKVFKDHSITFNNPNAEYAALSYCAALDLLKVTLDRTPRLLTPAGFVAALDGLGTVYQAPAALKTFLGRGRHDGVEQGYYWRYFADCKCLHYAGDLRTIPA